MITNDEEMESCDTLYELQSNRKCSARPCDIPRQHQNCFWEGLLRYNVGRQRSASRRGSMETSSLDNTHTSPTLICYGDPEPLQREQSEYRTRYASASAKKDRQRSAEVIIIRARNSI